MISSNSLKDVRNDSYRIHVTLKEVHKSSSDLGWHWITFSSFIKQTKLKGLYLKKPKSPFFFLMTSGDLIHLVWNTDTNHQRLQNIKNKQNKI